MQLCAILMWAVVVCTTAQAPLNGFRPPSVPVVTMDPFMNIWIKAVHSYDEYTTYWNSAHKPFRGLLRVDGETFRMMGPARDEVPSGTVVQESVEVWPTRTIFKFHDPDNRIQLTVQFTTPLLPQKWDTSSRPVTYFTYTAASLDGKSHQVQIYFDATELSVNDVKAKVTFKRFQILTSKAIANVMSIGTVSQSYFDTNADDDAIDWGHAYVAVVDDATVSTLLKDYENACETFTDHGILPLPDSTSNPRAANDNWITENVAWDFTLEESATVTKYVAFAYDDYYSVKYFERQFHPYWRRPSANASIDTILKTAIDEYENIMAECEQFDTQLVTDLEDKGGSKYATLAALAYRQTMAATKLVWNDQLEKPWAFLKSISTNDEDMSTVDAIAAASPLLLYQDPAFLQLLLLPILSYANNETGDSTYNYPHPWAPHHLGTYPKADILASEQTNMPMEETGNVFLMLAALTKTLGSDSIGTWYPQYWSLLQSWADYLVTTLPNPGDQTSADNEDPLSQNTNLAIKGILGLGAFSQLCSMVGKLSDSIHYFDLAESFAAQWVDMAQEGDHYKMAFDQENTWSLKYNLFYEKVLGLGLFPSNITSEEIKYYMNYHLNTYGIPLDSRVTYTKLEWMAWIAAMSDECQQEEMFDILYNWVHTSPALTPLTDWYDTISGAQKGYTARPAVGALYALMTV